MLNSIGGIDSLGIAFGAISENKRKELPRPVGKEDEKTLAEKLAAAVAEYKEKTLRGLNALTEAEIEERLNEFKALHKPEDGTEEELAAFYEKLSAFEQKLRMFVRGHSLITPSGGGEEEDGGEGSLSEQLTAQQAQFRVKQAAENL